MKEIQLTKCLVALVDDDMYDLVNQFKWHIDSKGYATRCARISKTKTKRVFMARFIMDEPKGKMVDHKDLNPLNNQLDNLRITTRGNNRANSKKQNGVSSSFKGVCHYPSQNKRNPFIASIKHNKKQIHLGYFSNEADAALAYNEAAIKYHGEFARLNIIL